MKYIFVFILFTNFYSNCFVTVGNPKANISLNLYLNLLDSKASNIVKNLLHALAKSCFKYLEYDILNVKMIPVIDDLSHPLRRVAFYINGLEKMESSGCLGCSYLKFIKASQYFINVNGQIEHLLALGPDVSMPNLAKEIMSIHNNLNVDQFSLVKTLKNYEYERIYNNNLIEYKFLAMDGNAVYANGVFLNGVEYYTEEDWEILFSDNKGASKETFSCENSQQFYENFAHN